MSWGQHPGWSVPPPAFMSGTAYDPRYGAPPGVFIPNMVPPWATPVSPGGQQPLPQHHGSIPPGHGLTTPSGSTAALSRTSPSLHPVLAHDTTLIRFDVSMPPAQSITPEWFQINRNQSAFTGDANGARPVHVRLLCKHPAAPWSIDIKAAPYSAPNTGVTCEDVWGGIYAALQTPIADSEWGFIVKDKGLVEMVNKAIQRRVRAQPGTSKQPLRIDCLGDAVLFRGLERDEEYAKLRLMPGSDKVKETWVVKLGN